MKNRILAVLLLAILVGNGAAAKDGGNRDEHPFGAYVSVLGDPYISIVGINLGVNLFSFSRVTAGYGSWTPTFTYTDGTSEKVKVTTTAAGVKFMVPSWNLTPFAGINYAQMTFERQDKVLASSSYSLSEKASITYPYWTAGIEFTASFGFYIAVGYNKPTGILASIPGLPYLNLGWFF